MSSAPQVVRRRFVTPSCLPGGRLAPHGACHGNAPGAGARSGIRPRRPLFTFSAMSTMSTIFPMLTNSTIEDSHEHPGHGSTTSADGL
jgi:hypothetical protein